MKKSEWKHQVWKARGKAMDTNTGENPGHQSQSQYLGNSPSEEEMGHWTPTGAAPMVVWMDGCLLGFTSSDFYLAPEGKRMFGYFGLNECDIATVNNGVIVVGAEECSKVYIPL